MFIVQNDTFLKLQWGKGAEVSFAFYWKLEKRTLILEKNVLIVVIYGLNFSFQVQFLWVSDGKKTEIFPAGPFFLMF